MILVRVPASTANLGPGFDALGMALSLYAEIGVVDDSAPDARDDDARGDDARGHVVDERHPASIAFSVAGGSGRLWVRSPIPMGRGLGYSGAMRVGGAAAALAVAGWDIATRPGRVEILAIAAGLERHADNAAASVYGGLVATDGERTVEVPMALDPEVVVWVPDSTTTSTSSSRAALPESVPMTDATFNIGRVAMLIGALVAGDATLLGTATSDRLHQDLRLARAPESAEALAAGLANGAWCGWLSGSGPSIALLVERGAGAALAAVLPGGGHAKVLSVDTRGVRLVD